MQGISAVKTARGPASAAYCSRTRTISSARTGLACVGPQSATETRTVGTGATRLQRNVVRKLALLRDYNLTNHACSLLHYRSIMSRRILGSNVYEFIYQCFPGLHIAA